MANLALKPSSIVEELSFEQILQNNKTKLQELAPELYSNLIDSDPAIKLLEVSSYREGLIRNRLNQGFLAITVQYAKGSDLDNLAAFYGITRKLIDKGDQNSIPPKLPIYEDDETLRQRLLEAPKGFSVAGPRSSYIYYGKLASEKVKDISAESPSAGVVDITVLSYEKDGTPDNELIKKVQAKLNDEEIRPLGDKVTARKAKILKYEIKAKLLINNTPNTEVILKTVKENIAKYVAIEHKLKGIVALSGIYAACHIEGVKEVILDSPSNNILAKSNEAPYCTSITLETIAEPVTKI